VPDLLAICLLASQCRRSEAEERLDGSRPMAHDEMQSPGPKSAERPSDGTKRYHSRGRQLSPDLSFTPKLKNRRRWTWSLFCHSQSWPSYPTCAIRICFQRVSTIGRI